MHLFRELLDLQVEDREGQRMGRVDAIVAEIEAGKPPRVTHLELGFVPLARRIHPALEPIAERWHKRLGVRRTARFHVPWAAVRDINIHRVRLDVSADETPAFDWERWLRRNVISRLPGSSSGDE
jgi:hypothetical protein